MIYGHNAGILADLVMDYCDDAPGYDATMDKLLAARNSEQDFQALTENDKLLILSAINEYLRDTAEQLTPSYDDPPFTSPAIPDLISERETLLLLREWLLRES